MREDAMEFGDPLARAPTQQELKIAERFAAYNTGDMDKVARIMSAKNNVASVKRIIAVSASIVQMYPRHHLQRATILLVAYYVIVYNQ